MSFLLIPLTLVLYIVLMIDKARSLGHALITFFLVGAPQYYLALQIDAYFTLPSYANHMGSWLVVGAIILVFLLASSIMFGPVIYYYLKKLSTSNFAEVKVISRAMITMIAAAVFVLLLVLPVVFLS